MNDNELLAKSSYWLTIILGNLYLRRWKIFWLEIFIIIILLYLCIKLEHFIKNQLNLDEENPAVLAEVKQLTTKVTNNFYGVGEVNLSVIADSVLTNFEYSLYYKK